MKNEQRERLAILEEELIAMMHDIEETGKFKRLTKHLDNAISEIEIVLNDYK